MPHNVLRLCRKMLRRKGRGWGTASRFESKARGETPSYQHPKSRRWRTAERSRRSATRWATGRRRRRYAPDTDASSTDAASSTTSAFRWRLSAFSATPSAIMHNQRVTNDHPTWRHIDAFMVQFQCTGCCAFGSRCRPHEWKPSDNSRLYNDLYAHRVGRKARSAVKLFCRFCRSHDSWPRRKIRRWQRTQRHLLRHPYRYRPDEPIARSRYVYIESASCH